MEKYNSSHKFWSKDYRTEQELDVLMNPKGKSCANCVFAANGKEFTTCGVLHENLLSISLCGIWTDKENEVYKDYRKDRREKLIAKINKG